MNGGTVSRLLPSNRSKSGRGAKISVSAKFNDNDALELAYRVERVSMY